MVFETIREMIVQCLGCEPERVTPDTIILEDLECGAGELGDVLLALEGEFGVTVPDELPLERMTVADLVRLAEKAE